MRVVLDIALTHLLSRRRQSFVSVLGVALGVGFFIAATALMSGSEQDFIQRMVNAYPHITVKDEYREPPAQPVFARYPDGAVDLRSLRPRDEVRGIRNYKGKVAELSRVQGMTVAPVLAGQAILRYGGKDLAAALTGIIPEEEKRVRQIEEDLIAGSLRDLEAEGNGLIIGHQIANRLGVGTGDMVSVISSVGQVRPMKIVGLIRTGVSAVDQTVAYASLTAAQVLLNRPQIANRLEIRLDDPYAAQATAQRIEGKFGYKAESWQEANADVLSVLVIRNIIFYSIVAAILVVASFGIFNIISTVILEKTRDIAILKSMGFREQDIRRIFLLEGAAVGVAGSLVGWAVGFAFIEVLGAIRITAADIIQADRLPLDRSFGQYALAASFAILAAVLAAYLPARKAARLRPVDILRGAA